MCYDELIKWPGNSKKCKFETFNLEMCYINFILEMSGSRGYPKVMYFAYKSRP